MNPKTVALKDSLSLSKGIVDSFDQKIESLFDLLRGNPALDKMFYTASQLGDYGLIWQLLAALKALGSKKHKKNFWRLSAALAVESVIVNGIFKSLMPRERPDPQEPRPLYLRQPITTSFPSGHASAAGLANVLLKDASKYSLYWPLGAVVAISRIYVRIHYASDVIAGAAFGYLLGKTVKRIWPIRGK